MDASFGTLESVTTEWHELEAIVATTHRVEKYGGIRLSEGALQQIADALNTGQVPMLGQHDWLRPIRTQRLRAQLVTLLDGERAVRLTGLVHSQDREAVGDVSGMSFSTQLSIGRAVGLNPEAEPVKLSADAASFDDSVIATACSLMSAQAPAEGYRLYQFSALDDLRIILEMGLNLVVALGPELATSAIWDGIKLMLGSVRDKRHDLAPIPTTRLELVTPLPTGEVIAVIDTPDIEIAREALAAYSQAVEVAAKAAAQREVIAWTPLAGGGGIWLSTEKGQKT